MSTVRLLDLLIAAAEEQQQLLQHNTATALWHESSTC
jgi:hypothetical protein